jgi:hypothetical protein
MSPRLTTWRINVPGKPEYTAEVPIPVSANAEEARKRHERNSRDQAIRYGMAPPSYTSASARRDDDVERELTR